MLVEGGALDAHDPRPDARATFDAEVFAPLLTDIAALIPGKDMCRTLGATTGELNALEAAGILRPRTALEGARQRWHPADALALIEELRGYCLAGPAKDGADWAPLQVVAARTGVSVEEIFAGLREKAIPLMRHDPAAGYHGFRVPVAAVMAYGQRGGAHEALVRGSSLSEFGRSVGIREMDRLTALIEAGELQAERFIHPVTRRPQLRVDEQTMSKFRDRFLTLAMIETEIACPV